MTTAKIGSLSLGGILTVCGAVGLVRHAKMGPFSLWLHVGVLALGLVCLFAAWRQK